MIETPASDPAGCGAAADGAVRFMWRGAAVRLAQPSPTLTVLDWLREAQHATGTKEGCAEGDCGACTVVLAELDEDGGADRVRWRAINACIRFVASLHGCALYTVEDLRAPDGSLHPVQQALVDCHGSQCGFCTPGFAMSMFALYNERQARAVSREAARSALSGNLCRCTGYRPILDAAEAMSAYPARHVDEAALARRLRALQADAGLDAPHATHAGGVASAGSAAHPAGGPDAGRRPLGDGGLCVQGPDGLTLRPATLPGLLAARRARPGAQVVAGGTDVGVWVNKRHRRFAEVLDVTGVRALQRIDEDSEAIAFGAAVRLREAYDRLAAEWPQLAGFADRFASLPVRNAGTLGGNVANGSPIGDSMPLLIALGAAVELSRLDAHGAVQARTLALEDFYLGYRRTALGADELLTRVIVPRRAPAPQGELLRAYKIAKRFDQDISAVCVAVRLGIERGTVAHARIGVGGMAAVPARARATEAALVGRAWDEAGARAAAACLRAEFSPIDDLRASAAYRHEVAGNLLVRLWLDSRGVPANLEGGWR